MKKIIGLLLLLFCSFAFSEDVVIQGKTITGKKFLRETKNILIKDSTLEPYSDLEIETVGEITLENFESKDYASMELLPVSYFVSRRNVGFKVDMIYDVQAGDPKVKLKWDATSGLEDFKMYRKEIGEVLYTEVYGQTSNDGLFINFIDDDVIYQKNYEYMLMDGKNECGVVQVFVESIDRIEIDTNNITELIYDYGETLEFSVNAIGIDGEIKNVDVDVTITGGDIYDNVIVPLEPGVLIITAKYLDIVEKKRDTCKRIICREP